MPHPIPKKTLFGRGDNVKWLDPIVKYMLSFKFHVMLIDLNLKYVVLKA